MLTLSIAQIPGVDANELESLVHALWRDVADFEHTSEVPKLTLATSILDFGTIGYDGSTLRTEQRN